ncbi:selenide, water dikinase SelD [Cyanobacteria bacterium FACHB-502]|nr:selenide, water dikinase SelD [Cyanobacteria bacterium FACHB-502]
MQSSPILKDLVLIGGGHSHAIVLKQFGMNPVPGVQLTLIADVSHTPYSGMLPGYIAGAYQFDECHIDLRPLCELAQGQMIVDRAIGLDLKENCVLFANRPPIAFDLLSIDIGSTPAAVTVPGAAEYAIPVKPISQFLQRWDQVIERIGQQSDSSMRLAVVGGGAGGVELILGLQARLRQMQQTSGQPSIPELHLFHKGDRLVPERHPRLGRQLERVMRDRGIHLHLSETVCEIRAVPAQSPPGLEGRKENRGGSVTLSNSTPDSPAQPSQTLKEIHCESGLTIPVTEVFWVTQASAASWLTDSGLKTDDRGFLLVDDRLRSISHPQVFAAGDVASMVNHPRPKAGVFAVRQGKPLANNLRRVLQGKDPQPFKPQKEFLILVGTGDSPEAGQLKRTAIASRGNLSFGPHPIFWKWKDSIDRRFMEKFTSLEPMMSIDAKPFAADVPPSMHCAGCGSKVGSSVLQLALNRINQSRPPVLNRPDILIGLDAPDDAAVVSVPSGQVMVQTVDYFRSLLSDPFIFGQIAANHALSDLFAMGAMPQSALAIVTLPYGTTTKQEETLYQVLSGAIEVLHQANAVLIGGHTIEGGELAFGLSCNGLATADQLWKKGGMQPGQALILTKPLGTGTLFAANMQLRAKGRWIEGAIDSMRLSNQFAIEPLRQSNTTACTDITGFGLLGHLIEMVNASRVAIDLDLNALPILEGAKETVQQGFLSSLHPQNFGASRFIKNPPVHHPLYPLLCDPQTSGGLLASVPGDQARDCLAALKNAGYSDGRIVGQVISATPENAATPIRITNTMPY